MLNIEQHASLVESRRFFVPRSEEQIRMDLFPGTAGENRTPRQQRIIDQAEAEAHAKLREVDNGNGCSDLDRSSPSGKNGETSSSGKTNSSSTRASNATDRASRRREINRVNAKKSRLRKKYFVESLVNAVERLEAENEQLEKLNATSASTSEQQTAVSSAAGLQNRPQLSVCSPNLSPPMNVQPKGKYTPLHGTMILSIESNCEESYTQGITQGRQPSLPTIHIDFASIEAQMLMHQLHTKSYELAELFRECDFRLIDPPVNASGLEYADYVKLIPDPTVCGALVEDHPNVSETGGHASFQQQMKLSPDDRSQTYGCAASISALQQAVRACVRDRKSRMLIGWIRLPVGNPNEPTGYYHCYSCTVILQYMRRLGNESSLLCSCTWERYPLPVPCPSGEARGTIAPVNPGFVARQSSLPQLNSSAVSPTTKPPVLSTGPLKAPQEVTPQSMLKHTTLSRQSQTFPQPLTWRPVDREAQKNSGNESNASDSSNSKSNVTDDPSRRGTSRNGAQSQRHSPPKSNRRRNVKRAREEASNSEADSQDSVNSAGNRGTTKNDATESSSGASVGSVMKAATGLWELGKDNDTNGASYGMSDQINSNDDVSTKREKRTHNGSAAVLSSAIPSSTPVANSILGCGSSQ